MDISLLTPDKQVKLEYWLDVIRQCRASGLTNQDWCGASTMRLLLKTRTNTKNGKLKQLYFSRFPCYNQSIHTEVCYAVK